MITIKSERRWQVRKLIIATNLSILGLVFFSDYNEIKLEHFMVAVTGFQAASAGWFIADYATKPKE